MWKGKDPSWEAVATVGHTESVVLVVLGWEWQRMLTRRSGRDGGWRQKGTGTGYGSEQTKGQSQRQRRRASSPPKEEGEESGRGFQQAAWTVEGWEWTLLFSLGCRKRSVLLGVSERLMANRLMVWRSHYNQQTHELRKKQNIEQARWLSGLRHLPPRLNLMAGPRRWKERTNSHKLCSD